MPEAAALAAIACSLFGYGLLLGWWLGCRHGRHVAMLRYYQMAERAHRRATRRLRQALS